MRFGGRDARTLSAVPDFPVELTETQRRVLGSLPVWRSQADVKRHNAERAELELQPAPRTKTVADLATDLGRDPHSAVEDTEEGRARVETTLEALEASGLVSHRGGEWSMLKEGLEALQA